MSDWWTIEEAPNYEINDKGHVRYKESKRCLKQRYNKMLDDPYVNLTVDGKTIPRSVYVLLKTMQITRRQ